MGIVGFNAGLAQPSDFFLEIARGNITGMSSIQKFGRNDDISAGVTEDIWAGGGIRAYLTSAETMDVVSTSANDDGAPAGTGAQTLTIEGLDSDYLEVSDTITMNGVTAVTTTQSFLRVHRAYVVASGSNETNVGDITIDPTTSGAGSRQAAIAAGDGQTLISHYTVPAAKEAYWVGGQLSIGSRSGFAGIKEARARFWKREENGSWRIQSDLGGRSDGTSVAPDVNFTVPVMFPTKTDLKWTGDAENNRTSMYVQYNLILVNI